MRKNGKFLNCLCCGKEFYVGAARISTAKYCSHECNKYKRFQNRTYTFTCKRCEKVFPNPYLSSGRPSRRIYCSKVCMEITTADRYDRKLRQAALRRLRPNTRVYA